MPPLLTIAGGVALILFGARFISKSLDRLFGPRLGSWMQRFAPSTPKAFVLGLVISIVAPSSTTMSVLSVQGVRSGQFTARQMTIAMLGAGIGLTVAVQLIALNLQQYAPAFILLGVILFMFMRHNRTRGVGQLVLALGFIFLAIGVIQTGADAFEVSGDLTQVLKIASRHPFLLALIAAVLGLGLQSSKASIGLLFGLSAAGIADLSFAAPYVVGVNVGLALTALILGWNQIEARRMALTLVLLRVLIGIPVLLAVGPVVRFIEMTPGPMTTKIANAHSIFNVVVAVVGIPLAGVLSNLAGRLAPGRGNGEDEFGPRHIRNFPTDAPALAMGQSMREILHLSEIVRKMLDDAWAALKSDDEESARQIAARDDRVDLLDAEIKRFLVRLGGGDHGEFDPREQMLQLRYLNEMETIGDVVDKNLTPLILKKVAVSADFSKEGWKDLDDFFRMVRENLLIADTVFMTRDRTMAQSLIRHKERLGEVERQMRDRHFDRLKKGLVQSQETTAIHLDLLTYLKRINSCAAHIAYDVVEEGNSAPPQTTGGG